MRALVFAPAQNTPGKHDATGAFQPEAQAFCAQVSSPGGVHLFDNTAPLAARKKQCAGWLASTPELAEVVAFFCHGWKDGFQAGWRTQDTASLADSLKAACVSGPRILLYACDTGRDADGDQADDLEPGPGGEGGFADSLRMACVKIGMRPTIIAHARAGHCTRNPWVRVFRPDEAGGGAWAVEPHSELWPRWQRALTGTLRFRFPFLTPAELDSELRSPAAVA